MVNSKHRILTISHGHPDFNKAGGEIAAYSLFKAYGEHPLVEKSVFLARHNSGKGLGCISLRRKDEYLWEQSIGDWFLMKSSDWESQYFSLISLINNLKPTAIHIHHYIHIGLEFLAVIKRINPTIKIILTLHEYAAICFNQGQMVRPISNQLCYEESPLDCHNCFPDRSQEDFWLRKQRYLDYFKFADYFIAPSAFLRSRYIEWGLPEQKISLIENGQYFKKVLPPRNLKEGETRNRFGYFGQINPFKGVDLLMEALQMLPKKIKISVDINGSNFNNQPKEFENKIQKLKLSLVERGILQWSGTYRHQDMGLRMANIDWVVVPSIWWENSPMVIQEAFGFGRPIIVSDIGGMAEKVSNGINGLHVPVGSAFEWSNTIREASLMLEEWDELYKNIATPLNHSQCAQAHLCLISTLI